MKLSESSIALSINWGTTPVYVVGTKDANGAYYYFKVRVNKILGVILNPKHVQVMMNQASEMKVYSFYECLNLTGAIELALSLGATHLEIWKDENVSEVVTLNELDSD